MLPFSQLDAVRAVFARQILALANASENKRLEQAFASIARERFLGADQWQILTPWNGYTALQENDPALIYQDVVIGLDPERGVNNGSPVLHARWMNAMQPKAGEVVAHIGAGAGYYTSILAQLVGPTGKVLAVECDEKLAARLEINLAAAANIEVIRADGASQPEFPVDAVYVNYGVARPAGRWLENLRPAGRLVLPLGVPQMHATLRVRVVRHSIGLMVTRKNTGFAAMSLGEASFLFAHGLLPRPDADIDALRKSLATGQDRRIRSLIWRKNASGSAWFEGQHWALSFDEPA